MLKGALQFDRQHVILNNLSHAAGGFGLAVVLQQYVAGNAFISPLIGWVLLAFTIAIHFYAWTR